MLVMQPLDKESKLQLTLKQVNEMCTNRHELLGEDNACTECMFHEKGWCQVEGMPKYWMEDNDEN